MPVDVFAWLQPSLEYTFEDLHVFYEPAYDCQLSRPRPPSLSVVILIKKSKQTTARLSRSSREAIFSAILLIVRNILFLFMPFGVVSSSYCICFGKDTKMHISIYSLKVARFFSTLWLLFYLFIYFKVYCKSKWKGFSVNSLPSSFRPLPELILKFIYWWNVM